MQPRQSTGGAVSFPVTALTVTVFRNWHPPCIFPVHFTDEDA